MRILIINNKSRNLRYLTKLFRKLNINYFVKNQRAILKQSDYKKADGVILSGGPRPNLDEVFLFNTIRANMSCLINCSVPILGICEGHEIIGEACGGEVYKLQNPSRSDTLAIKIRKKTRIFEGLPDVIHGYERHFRYVRRIPDILEKTASSRKDNIEAFFHKKKPIFGVQFHPERSGEAGEKIIKNFIHICKEVKRKKREPKK